MQHPWLQLHGEDDRRVATFAVGALDKGGGHERHCSPVDQGQVDAGGAVDRPGGSEGAEGEVAPRQQGAVDVHPRATRSEELNQQRASLPPCAALAHEVQRGVDRAVEVPKQQGRDLQVQPVRELGESEVEPRQLHCLDCNGAYTEHSSNPRGSPARSAKRTACSRPIA